MTDERKWDDGYVYPGDRYHMAHGTEAVRGYNGRLFLELGDRITKCGPGWSDYNWHKDDRPPVGTVHGPTGLTRYSLGWAAPDDYSVWCDGRGEVFAQVRGVRTRVGTAHNIEEAHTLYLRQTEGYNIDERPEAGTVCPVSGLVYRGGYWEPKGGVLNSAALWSSPSTPSVSPGDLTDAQGTVIATDVKTTAEAGRILDEHRAKQAPTFDASTIADIPADEGAAQLQRMATRTVERADEAPKPAVWRTEPPTEADVGHVWLNCFKWGPRAAVVSVASSGRVMMSWSTPLGSHHYASDVAFGREADAWAPANTTPPAWVGPAAEKLRGVLSRALGIDVDDEQLAAVMAEGVMG